MIEKKYLLPFILITSLFALWGFANDITNPMVAAFQTLMELSATKASMVQFAFYGGYATMALPAALFIRKFSYKRGIMLGLALYAVGAFLFIPAAVYQEFSFFCISLYILSLGTKETSTRRLNLAQAFNPMGSLCGMAVASLLVLPNLISDKRNSAGEILFSGLSEAEKANIRLHDLAVIRDPYVAIGLVVLVVLLLISVVKMPDTIGCAKKLNCKETMKNLLGNVVYREGVIAQVMYVAAQIMVWTFIIHYADNLGINKATAQNYNIIAMIMFLCARFVSTFLMRYIGSRQLLTAFAIGASLCTVGTICFVGMTGLYCLIAISFFMSLMFPSIYGIALENVSQEDSTIGAAFLVMAIVGGALMPPLQGMVIDYGTLAGYPAVNISFALPLVCFLFIAIYGYRTIRLK